ncbi:MAG: CapA family protein [Lachnospiraceae bacterium]|nr:CapA family protein [Lachnospiraceae bacterium]
MTSNTTSCSLVFTGDIGFDRYMEGRFKDPQLLSPAILDFCQGADHVIANVEGAMLNATDDGSRGVFFHSMDPEAVCVLDQIHADIWNISNNHIMDAGLEGLLQTQTIAGQHQARTLGAGVNEDQASQPVFLPEAGGIGLLGVAYMTECIPATDTDPGVFRWDHMDLIGQRIRQIKEQCRWCIIVAHGGEEFADLPNPYTRDRYRQYLEMGADLVVAHHPHVPENYELLENGKAIFYSLGNFIFDTDYQRAHPYTDLGVLLKLTLTPETMSFEALGTRIVRGAECIEACPVPDIFANIPARDYELLSPLAAKAFLHEECKKMIYLEPERFEHASEDVWNSYFFSTEPDGYDKGAHMDLELIVPLARQAEDQTWKQSQLEAVKEYLLRHFEEE